MMEHVHVYSRSKSGQIEPLEVMLGENRHAVLHVESYEKKHDPRGRSYYDIDVDIEGLGSRRLQYRLVSGQWFLS